MIWFERLTGKTPQVAAAIEAEKERLRKEGEALSDKMAADAAAKKAAMEAEYAAKTAALDKEAAVRMRESNRDLNDALKERSFQNLELALKIALTPTLARANLSDPAAALNAMTNEIAGQVNSLRSDTSETKIAEVERWALAKVGASQQYADRVRKAFVNFKDDLNN